MESTVNTMAKHGKRKIHQAIVIRSLPSATITPHAGVGAGMPAPRKLRVDSKMITCPTSKVASTTTVLTKLGNMCRSIIRAFDAPETRARSIKSCCLMARASPRTTRAYLAHSSTAMTMMTVVNPAPMAATSTRASRMEGNASLMSTTALLWNPLCRPCMPPASLVGCPARRQKEWPSMTPVAKPVPRA